MATLERKTAIIKKVLSEVNLDINDGNVHKYADYTGFVKPRLNAIYDIISKIAPTPFDVNNNYVGKSIANRNKGYDKIRYYDISNILISLIKDATGTQLKTLFYIINNLEWNSNIVYLDYDVIADELNVGRRAIIDVVAFLCNNSIICRTDIRGVFVVNHNLVFRGNIEQFYKTYTAFYHDKLVVVSNKVVLNK